MIFSNELIEKAKTASSAEELRQMAETEGIELSAAEAEAYFGLLAQKKGFLSDDELEQISGGKGEKEIPDPKYKSGQTVEMDWPGCTLKGKIKNTVRYSSTNGWLYAIHFYQEIYIWNNSKEINSDYDTYLETPTLPIRVYWERG